MTDAQRIQHNLTQTKTAWIRAKRNVAGNPVTYRADRFPDALGSCDRAISGIEKLEQMGETT